MKYIALYRPTTGEEGGMPDPEHMAAMGRLVEDSMKAGKLISTEPLTVRSAGAKVTRSGDGFSVADLGDRMAGFAFLNASSREEAIAFCKEFLAVAGEGSCEIRQVLEF